MATAFMCDECGKAHRADMVKAPENPFSLNLFSNPEPRKVPSAPGEWFIVAKADEAPKPGFTPALLCSTDCVMRFISRGAEVPEVTT